MIRRPPESTSVPYTTLFRSGKVPYLAVVGDKEVENNAVAVRTRKGEDLGTMSIEAFEKLLQEDIQRKGRTKTEI